MHDPTTHVPWPTRFNEVPKDIFYRQDVYEQELQKIFQGPDWFMVAHVAELREPGDYKTVRIGELPVILVHGKDGHIRAFENTCTHRGTQVATCPRGHTKKLQCPYHRWNFSLEGELIGAPGMKDFSPEFRKEDYSLRPVRLAQYLGIIFVTANDETAPIDDWLNDTRPYLAKALNGDGKLRLLGYQKTIFNTNWKAYADNDGYHGPLLHAAFRLLQLARGEGVQFMTVNAHKVNSALFPPPRRSEFLNDSSLLEARDPKTPAQNTVISLFPHSIVVRNLDSLALRYAFPLGVNKTEVHYAYFGHQDDDEDLIRHRIRQGSNLAGPSGFITLEDGAVFDRLQVGLHTRGTAAFQMGVKDGRPFSAPCETQRSDEAGNLIRWERYRMLMEFARD